MDTEPNSQEPTTKRPQDKSTLLMIFGDIADTTWRMFVPVVGFAALGLYLDIVLDMVPWLTISLTVVGAFIAALLVWRQIKRISDK